MKGGLGVFLLLVLLSGNILFPISMTEDLSSNQNLCPFDPQIDEQIQDIMNATYIPSCTAAVVGNNTVVWTKGYGEQSDTDLIYMTGSVTKTITATAIFQLIEQGIMDLDDDVNNYLPFSLRNPNYPEIPITIRMLLLHISSLNKATSEYELSTAQDLLDRLNFSNHNEWLPYPDWFSEFLVPDGTLYNSSIWSSYEPGTVRVYSNVGYEVLAYALHCATGQPIWEFVTENIFEPLNMENTAYNFTNLDESKLAIPYWYDLPQDPRPTENRAYPHWNSVSYGAGAVRSNVFDMARFLMVHMHNGVSNGTRILQETTITQMHEMEASWVQNVERWLGWGGTEGDTFGFHAKAYAIHSGATSVPYATIVFVNQGMDAARDACFNITMLLAEYVNDYDSWKDNCTEIDVDYLPLLASLGVLIVVSLMVLVFFRLRK